MKTWLILILFVSSALTQGHEEYDEDNIEFHAQDPEESIQFKTPSGSVCHYVEAHDHQSIAGLFIDCECKAMDKHTQKYGCLYSGNPEQNCFDDQANRERFFKEIITIFERDQVEACSVMEFDAANYTRTCTAGVGPVIMKRRLLDGIDPSGCNKKHEEL